MTKAERKVVEAAMRIQRLGQSESTPWGRIATAILNMRHACATLAAARARKGKRNGK